MGHQGSDVLLRRSHAVYLLRERITGGFLLPGMVRSDRFTPSEVSRLHVSLFLIEHYADDMPKSVVAVETRTTPGGSSSSARKKSDAAAAATISLRRLSAESGSGVAGLSLTAYCEHEDCVDLLDVAIQSYVTTGAASDDQLPRTCGYGSADNRIVMEYVDSLNDFPDTARRIFNSVLLEMFEDTIEVIPYIGSQLDPGHP